MPTREGSIPGSCIYLDSIVIRLFIAHLGGKWFDVAPLSELRKINWNPKFIKFFRWVEKEVIDLTRLDLGKTFNKAALERGGYFVKEPVLQVLGFEIKEGLFKVPFEGKMSDLPALSFSVDDRGIPCNLPSKLSIIFNTLCCKGYNPILFFSPLSVKCAESSIINKKS